MQMMTKTKYFCTKIDLRYFWTLYNQLFATLKLGKEFLASLEHHQWKYTLPPSTELRTNKSFSKNIIFF